MQLSHLTAFAASAATAAMLAPSTPAQTLVRAVNSPAANAQYGKACINVPDQNADGYKDLLVGAPGFNSQRGAIYCLSGAYLASGAGPQTLWSLAPTANAGDLFGYALVYVGDVTGDGIGDFLVGQPGYDSPSPDTGAVVLVNGASHAAYSRITGFASGCLFGSAVAACGDATGDGLSEVVIGGPGSGSGIDGRAYSVNGVDVATNASITAIYSGVQAAFAIEFGASLASGFDADGDGYQEIVLGAPGFANGSGAAYLLETNSTGALLYRASYLSQIPGERMGSSVDGGHDYDGDGVLDFVVGAPKSPNGTTYELGRATVVSTAKLMAQTAPYEIYTFTTTPGFAGSSHFHFGAAVRASGDLTGDGIGEIIIGAPDYFSNQFTGPGRGFAQILSGATGSHIAYVLGASHERVGDSLGGALADLDGDGFEEFTVAGWSSDTGGTDSGVVKCYRLFPVAPGTYCTSKLNSLACTPAMSYSGSPSETSGAPFLVSASNFINQKNGLYFYSQRPTAVAFQGGTKCVRAPFTRGAMLNSGGSPSGADCTGTYSFNFNAWIQSGSDPALVAGAEVYVQYWARDPASPSHTSLSNALRFLINP